MNGTQNAKGVLVPSSDDGLFGWIPALVTAYSILISPLLLLGAGENNDTAGSANTLNQVFWILLMVVVLFKARLNLPRVLSALRQPVVVAIGVYLCLAVISALWSPVPQISLRRSILQIILTICVIVPVVLARDHERQIDRVLWCFVIAIWVNLAAVVLLPAGRLGHEAIYSHKNLFGVVIAYGLIFCLYGSFRKRGGLRLISLISVFVCLFELFVSKSKTSLGLSLLVPLSATLLLGLHVVFGVNIVILFFFSLLLAAVTYFLFVEVFDLGFPDVAQQIFGDPTFTGRTIIWDFVAGIIDRAPMLGQGFGSFWGIGDNSIAVREAPGFVADLLQSHSGYLDIVLELGFTGLAVFTLLITAVFYSLSRLPTSERLQTWLLLSLTLFALIHNAMESSFFRGYSITWVMFLIGIGFSGVLGSRNAKGEIRALQTAQAP